MFRRGEPSGSPAHDPERYRSGRNGGASKASCRVSGTWVRIPPSPPSFQPIKSGRLYRPLVSSWVLYDSSGPVPRRVAEGVESARGGSVAGIVVGRSIVSVGS